MIRSLTNNDRRFVRLGILLLVLVLAVATGAAFANPAQDTAARETHIFFHTGSPLLLSGDTILPLDPANPDVAATVVNSRTLLPLRAFAEYFGAKVHYAVDTRTAVIELDGVRYLFPIGQNKYIVDDGSKQTEKAMDVSSLIQNSRTMVPMRVLCEEVFDKVVSYHDRVIAVGDTAVDLKLQTTLLKQVKDKIGVAVKARSLDEVKLAIAGGSSYVYGRGSDIAVEEQAAAPAMDGAGEASGGGSKSYSTTNIQVEGIDEADIVKTDGDYIYIAAEAAIRIVKADGGSMREVAVLRIDESKYVTELFLDGDRLVVLGTRNENRWIGPMPYEGPMPVDIAPDGSTADKMIMPPYDPGKTFSFAEVYDISDPSSPELVKAHEMEGHYQTSRKNGDIVYLITNTYAYDGIVLPLVRDTAAGEDARPIALSDVMILPRYPAQGFIAVSALDIRTHEQASVEAIAASGTVTYMNDSALYIAASDFNGNTAITKFTVSGLNVGYAGSGTVAGYLVNQFAMDEYDGHLRTATTTWDGGNHLFILDGSMNTVGSVTGLAEGETIYSVRFLGDKGYIVTFRTVDPLFVFDLSDPAAPRLTGELKIPGFSNYLHPVGEDRILGIGMDTYEIYQKDRNGNEIVIGTRQGGIKISLFDVSDMGRPQEIDAYVLGDSGSYADALYNHKAILFDPARELLAFDASITGDPTSYKYEQGAAVIGYSDDSLSLEAFLSSVPSERYGSDLPYGRRVLYIDDTLYYIQGSTLRSYDYDTFQSISTLTLD